MILENYLSEATLNTQDISDVEMSNEGFTHESGGGIRAIMLAEEACNELDIVVMASECKACKIVNESGDILAAYTLQENVITNALAGIRKIIMKLWSRMKEVVSSVKMQFEKWFNNSAFIKDAEKILSKMSDFKDLEFEGYNFTIGALDPKATYNKGSNLAATLYSKVNGKLSGITPGSGDGVTKATQDAVDNAKDEMDELKGEKFNKALSEDVFGCEPDKVNEEIFKKLRSGKDSEEKLTWNKAACMNAVKNLSSLSNTVNSVAQDIDTTHKAAIKAIDNDISNAGKTDGDADQASKPLTSAKLQALKDKGQCVQAALALANKVTNAKLQALKDECSQSKNFISAAIRQGRKNSHASESTNLLGESAGFIDTLLANY